MSRLGPNITFGMIVLNGMPLVLLGALVGVLIESLTSFGFLSPTRYPMGFWLFAFLAAEACRRRAERALALPVTREEPHAVA